MNNLNKLAFGKMTQQEKKLNWQDLANYKVKQAQNLNAMIPGLNNIPSIGTQPFHRGALNVMQYADEAALKAEWKKGQIFFSP